ncbi:MAG: UvrD-helicase domain-containing protein [Candidatus Latescibacterota bacterium]
MTIDFTPEQQEFLRHPRNEHARLLAGPGTGKSTTIIEYAGLLLRDEITAIRLLTFTRAATAELADSLDDANTAALKPSTIHSFAIALVLRNPGTADVPLPLRIMTDWEWDNLVRPRITKRLKLGKKWRDADLLRREKAAEWESLTPEKNDKDRILRSRTRR